MDECLQLKKSNCKNCYKCIRNCPVKSIRFAENQAQIIAEDCILCGHCFLACPQNAKEIRNDVQHVRDFISGGRRVYASIAPSFISNYDHISFASMEQALKKLGFAGAEETAFGAAMVAGQYQRLVCEEKNNLLISTCCHTVNLLLQKYYPELIPHMAPVLSPMQAHCRDLKRRYPDAQTVFIGPCISKKAEAENCREDVDCVLTFEELSLWMKDENIVFEPAQDTSRGYRARMFPVAGGIIASMTDRPPSYTYLVIDGVENCMQALQDIKSGRLSKCFIEMSACPGGCINGPAVDKNHRAPVRDYIAVSDYSKDGEGSFPEEGIENLSKTFFSLAPRKIILTDSAINVVLREMGKTKPEHELNCGSCGYGTCREKARAVIEGKANLAMCLPYLKEKAESFSNIIIGHTPNAIVVVNENYEIQMVNNAACELLKIIAPVDVIGCPVVSVLDPELLAAAHREGKNTFGQKLYLAEYGKYVEQTVIYDQNSHIIIVIMRDITDATVQAEKRQNLNRKTAEVTDKVIEKQMRTVQEIASLLGETTAETKVALTKLKESLYNE